MTFFNLNYSVKTKGRIRNKLQVIPSDPKNYIRSGSARLTSVYNVIFLTGGGGGKRGMPAAGPSLSQNPGSATNWKYFRQLVGKLF